MNGRLFLALVAVPLVSLGAEDANEIVRRSVQADQRTLELAKDYSYQEIAIEKDLDAAGNVKSTESKTYDVLILYGTPFRKLIAKNGKALSAGEQAKEQEKVDKEIEKRGKESPEQRRKREEKDEKERAEIQRNAGEIPRLMNLTLVGEETIAGRPVYVISADPKPGPVPSDSKAKYLAKMRGKLWIDKADYHWVKLEAEPLETISFGLVLARLGPGTRIFIEQTRVNDEVWVPSNIRVKLDARLALLKKFRKEIEVTYRDYRKFRTDSRVVATSADIR